MKTSRPSCGLLCGLFLCVVAFDDASATIRNWTNSVGGSWFDASGWSPNGVPGPADTANLNTAGTYTVVITNAVNIASLNLGNVSGAQTLLVDNGAALNVASGAVVQPNGILTVTNGGFQGQLVVQSGGQLSFTGAAIKTLYSCTLINQGTVTWNAGYLYMGGTPTTVISNGGLWQITSDYYIAQVAGGPTPVWDNSGILRKSAGSGTSQIDNFAFTNEPGALVDVQSGMLQFNNAGTNILGGNFTTSAGATLDLNGGTYFDAGAVFSGAGVNEFTGTTLDLRTNILSGLSLVAGSIYVMPTFQQSGAITNLTLDGATLYGTNQIGSGTLTIDSGGVSGQLTVQLGGQLLFATTGIKTLYSLTLLNQGTVNWASGYLYMGGTPTTVISNGGLWQATGDYYIAQVAGGPVPLWINSGILRKSAGTGSTLIDNFEFDNQPGGLVDAQTGTIQFDALTTNALAGTFNSAAGAKIDLNSGTYLDAGAVFTGAGVNEFTGTTLDLRTNTLSGLLLAGGGIVVMPTFQQGGTITNLTLDGVTLHGTNQVGPGTLTINSGGVDGQLTVLTNGQLAFGTAAVKTLYALTLLNQGTVTWSNGYLYTGGTPTTVVSNGGLWQTTGDFYIAQVAGGPVPFWLNAGILRKNGGTGVSQIDNFAFTNQPGGLVDVQSGTLQFNASNTTNVLAGNFTTSAGATLDLNAGTYLDADGVFSGAGVNEFTGTTLILRTNVLSGLLLASGGVYVTPPFQQSGAITNLTLDGATLHGTNQVGAGVLTVNSGGIDGQLTILPAGQLSFATTAVKTLYSLTLLNQGTVNWPSGYLYMGGTPTTVVSNGGLWQITGDFYITQVAGGPTPQWMNPGTLRKSAGSGTSQILNFQLDNSPHGTIQVDSGTLVLPAGFTNTAGTLHLNGGTLAANGTLTMTSGTLNGSGTLGANALNGGTISPGNSPGTIAFNSGLNLGSNVTLVVEGVGTVPGSQYDQLAVSGPIVLGNATLQVSSMPSVPTGTTFFIVTNQSGGAVSGTFNGLPENSLITASGQPFRIHYAGPGNSVTLVRDVGAAGPNLSAGTYTGGTFHLLGLGGSSVVYEIQASTNLLQWTNIGTATGDVSGNFIFTDTNAANFRYRFYRTTN